MSEWIREIDQRPALLENVLTAPWEGCDPQELTMAFFHSDKYGWLDSQGEKEVVEFWQPLPDPPKEQGS